MITFELTEVVGWEHAIRGMRNPMNSWEKSDTYYDIEEDPSPVNPSDWLVIRLGPNDHSLMKRLRDAGTDHRKFMRMIAVYVDITAPLYWWKEFDTYKVGTVANSCSTMHKITEKEFTLEDFSCEHLIQEDDTQNLLNWGDFIPYETLGFIIGSLNESRRKYLETKTKPMKNESARVGLMKRYWWQIIQLLPSSYNQKRTVMLNYEVLANIYHSRKNHKLDEWRVGFMDWIKSLPYSELITGEEDNEID